MSDKTKTLPVQPIRMGDSVGMQVLGSPKAHPRTSKPGTCLWCGKKLRLAKAARQFNTSNRGDYGDNAFCTLRCGYCFGVGMAKLGKRFADGWEYFTPEDPQ
jgi:hypothetical protein